MRKVTVHAAKTQLSRLIEAALSGEEVTIAKGQKPVVRLVPIPQGRLQFTLVNPDSSFWPTPPSTASSPESGEAASRGSNKIAPGLSFAGA